MPRKCAGKINRGAKGKDLKKAADCVKEGFSICTVEMSLILHE